MGTFTDEQRRKGNETKAKTLTTKQKLFIKEFVKTKNGTASARAVYNVDNDNVAGIIAHDNLSKPKIKNEILNLLNANDVDLVDIVTIHKRNMFQDTHLPTSQKAVSDFYEILGMKSGDKPDSSVKIAFIIEK